MSTISTTDERKETDTETDTTENNVSTSSNNVWGSWFSSISTVAKQVQERTVQAAHELSERAKQTHLDFLLEKERAMQQPDTEAAARSLPWVRKDGSLPTYWKELKNQILQLSNDEATFTLEADLEQIPSHVSVKMEDNVGLATALLEEDPILANKRYQYVPSKLTDETFWERYLTRVFCIQLEMQRINDDADHPAWWRDIQSPQLSHHVATPSATSSDQSTSVTNTHNMENDNQTTSVDTTTLTQHQSPKIPTLSDDEFSSAIQALHTNDIPEENADDETEMDHTQSYENDSQHDVDFEQQLAAELGEMEDEQETTEETGVAHTTKQDTNDEWDDLAELESNIDRELSALDEN